MLRRDKGGTQIGVLQNRVSRRIYGPKSKEVSGDWRRLHNEELHNSTLHQILIGWSNKRGCDVRAM